MWIRSSEILVLLLGAVLMAASSVAQGNVSKHVVCYQGTWSVYRPGTGQFGVEDIDPFLCTHLIYAFLGIEESGQLRVIDSYLDLEDNSGRGNIKSFNALKLKNPTLKTLAAIGGWNEGSKKFSIVAADAEKRARFVNDVVHFLQRHGFDGLDLDWEYPGQRHSLDNEDRTNYITLLKELKEGLEPFSYILSAAVGSAQFSAETSYEIPAIVPYLDLINVMAYDLHGPWDEVVGINAPLYPAASDKSERQKQLNVDAIFKYWLNAGAPPEKLVLGVPFYGRSFTLASADSHEPGSPHIGRGIAGKYSREPGVLGYNELCELMQQEDWTEKWETDQQVPYAYRQRQWVGYENPRSLSLKAQYVVDHHLGGIMIWSLESDDFHGTCGQERYPLVHAINRVLFGSDTPTGLTPEPSKELDEEEEKEGFSCLADGPTGFVRDPHNCSKFYYCNGGITHSFDCPTGLSFDPHTDGCNYSASVKC
ncbi:GL10147 [Drosophila persimilis]|uniref:chitinase n=1 Tax=Drosophila persimilis TaxID=7234 RepID=B4H4Y1_DROPE|nr:chitinase-3-like protein 1 [Drosophila persimilis]XP_017147078.1 chitinase-3-like protein 1 [Drosophila miranda]EDW32817.1 GL10147 [Drosophila persimilis]